ncbi:MAG: nuclear transport factor 2 family protein [Deltaproteobacteria bacterium]|nr:nuclear transport factor 2 family protein [Deltaproteobacteria bacterium]
MTGLAEVFRRYAAFVSANDVAGIVSLYAPNATIQIPVGGPVHAGIDQVRAFYRDNELARKLEITGPACIAGREGAVPMCATIARDGELLEVDVIDVAELDEAGRLLKLRAFFDLAGARKLGRAEA